MEPSSMKIFAATCLALSLGACTTMGTGSGSTLAGTDAVKFAWKSRDGGVTGTVSATLADGTAYTGRYLELTSTVSSSAFYPIWDGWTPGWTDWGYDPADYFDGLTVNYTGKVVANLVNPTAQRMRCRFALNDPPAGMRGGGQGKCQLANGTTLDATFPRA